MHSITSFLVILLNITLVTSNGMVEVLISSPETILLTSSVCTTIRCSQIDGDARKVKINKNSPHRIQDAPFHGEAPRYYDIHLSVFSTNGDEIGKVFVSPEYDSNWQSGSIETSLDFNVTFKFRIICDNNYYGIKCNRFCQDSVQLHTECTRSGERKCMDGWKGFDCMTPICEDECNGRGKCVAPGQCRCNHGYSGATCDSCIPTPGCVHGGCANNVSFTCQCKRGYGGELCTKDLEKCERERPCLNGGVCRNALSSNGFTCNCPEGYMGDRCEIAINSVKCTHSNGNNVCLNGGICVSITGKSIECKCKPGYSGTFCENGNDATCGSMTCQNGGKCFMVKSRKPACQCATCYRGDRCEILDADCLLKKMSQTVKAKESEGGISSKVLMITVISSVIVLMTLIVGFLYITRPNKTTIEDDHNGNGFEKSFSIRKPTYKVCIIDAERGSTSEPTSSLEQSSPPPSYYPPPPKYSSPRHYRTLPTSENHSIVKKPTIL